MAGYKLRGSPPGISKRASAYSRWLRNHPHSYASIQQFRDDVEVELGFQLCPWPDMNDEIWDRVMLNE